MKEYRLIQEYPMRRSLSVGSTVKEDENLGIYSYAGGKLIFSKEEVENFPAHWEEIIPKDYEILSFKHIYGNLYSKLGSKDEFYLVPEKPYTEEKLLNQADTIIYSIKRLSDGEVFTVGDKVTSFIGTTRGKNPFHAGNITSIIIREDVTLIIQIDNGRSVASIENIEHAKKPKLVPFDFSDAEKIIGKAIKAKDSPKFVEQVTAVADNFIWTYHGAYDFKCLLEEYTFLDGSPCGKLIG